MNLPNKITFSRIILTLLIMIILLFPFDSAGIFTMNLFINEAIVIDIKYIVAGVLFIIAALTDYIDGRLARKYNMVTDLGKMMDNVADKVLVNLILVILATYGFISIIIPVVVISVDIFLDSIKMIVNSKNEEVSTFEHNKIRTICMLIGIVLTFFYNLPFELINLRVSDTLLAVACILSVVYAIEYFNANKHFIIEPKPKKSKQEVVEDELMERLKEIEKVKTSDKIEKIEII